MIERLPSGNRRLDLILGGGLPANAINLIIGAPGSGKTILSQQFVFANASAERPALYLSTVSEPFDKLIRYGQNLSFFDVSMVGKAVIYEDLGSVLVSQGLAGLLERVNGLIKQYRPGIVVIDSFRALRVMAPDEGDFRRFLHTLAGTLTATAASTFWIGEYDHPQLADAPELAVADAIVALVSRRLVSREIRVLQVLKLRGSGFLSGEHAYRISADGLEVYPRLADTHDESGYQLADTRHSTGVAALDEVLGDGYWVGASTLVCGPSGIGKTLLGLHFIFKGAELGEPGIIAALEENQTQLERVVRGFGWTLDMPGVHLLARSPVDLYLDQWVYELIDLVEAAGARRVMIDSIPDLSVTAGDETRFREWMYSLTQRFSRAGISLLMTYEMPDLFEMARVSDIGVSHLSDNVVLLRYQQAGPRLLRTLTVLKTRASDHEPIVREYQIRSDGIVLAGPLAPDGDGGVIEADRQPLPGRTQVGGRHGPRSEPWVPK